MQLAASYLSNYSTQAHLMAAEDERDALAKKIEDMQNTIDNLLDRYAAVRAKSRVWKGRCKQLWVSNQRHKVAVHRQRENKPHS